MKGFVCVLSVLIVAVCVNCEPSPEMKKIFDECMGEVGLPAEKSQGPPNFDDPKVKCMHACVMKKQGKIENGKVVPEKEIEFAMKHIPGADNSVKEKLTECANTANAQSDECEVAAAMHKCFREKIGRPHH